MDVMLPPDTPLALQALFWIAAIGAVFSVIAFVGYAAAQRRFKVRNYFRPHLLIAMGTALSCLAVMLFAAHSAGPLGGVSNLGVTATLGGVALQLFGTLEMARRRRPRSAAHFRETQRALRTKKTSKEA